MKNLLRLVALFLLSAGAIQAEYRMIGIEISSIDGEKGKPRILKINIHSDVAAENKAGIGLEEAKKTIKKVVGWGSGVGVAVTVERAVLYEYISLVDTIAANPMLDLMIIGPPDTKVAKQVLGHFKAKAKRAASKPKG